MISAWWASKRPWSASRSAGIFARSFPIDRSASTSGSVVPPTSASRIARPDLPRMSLATQSSLMPASSSAFVQPVGFPLALGDLRLAVPGQRSQPALRLGSHEAAAQQPGVHQLAQPLCVTNVGLAARDVLDVTRVAQRQLEVVFEDVPDGQPIHPQWPPSPHA
jgi:hypothetical protein